MTTELQTTLRDAIDRSRQLDDRISVEVDCDIDTLVCELSALADEGIEIDYAQENDGRHDVWGYDPDQDDDSMAWRLIVTCRESA
jgi:hypothetical protein